MKENVDAYDELRLNESKNENMDDEIGDSNNASFYSTDKSSLNILHSETSNLNLNKIDDQIDIEKQSNIIITDDKVYGNQIKNKRPFKMGKVITFLYYKTQPIIVIGPDWPLTLCLFCFIGVFNLLLINYVYSGLSPIIYYMGIIIYLTQAISHVLTACINPGIPSRDYFVSNFVKERDFSNRRKKEGGYKICSHCNIIVHSRKNVAHCEDCNICVEEHDHHCAWSGKCIGKINLYPFYVFVFSTFLFILFMFLSTMIFLVTFSDRKNKKF